MGVEVDSAGHGVQLGGLGDGVDGCSVGVGGVGGDAQPGQDGRQGHGGAAVRCTDPILALAIHVHTGGVNLDTAVKIEFSQSPTRAFSWLNTPISAFLLLVSV